MKNKPILVEGIPGAGKTFTARKINIRGQRCNVLRRKDESYGI